MSVSDASTSAAAMCSLKFVEVLLRSERKSSSPMMGPRMHRVREWPHADRSEPHVPPPLGSVFTVLIRRGMRCGRDKLPVQVRGAENDGPLLIRWRTGEGGLDSVRRLMAPRDAEGRRRKVEPWNPQEQLRPSRLQQSLR